MLLTNRNALKSNLNAFLSDFDSESSTVNNTSFHDSLTDLDAIDNQVLGSKLGNRVEDMIKTVKILQKASENAQNCLKHRPKYKSLITFQRFDPDYNQCKATISVMKQQINQKDIPKIKKVLNSL